MLDELGRSTIVASALDARSRAYVPYCKYPVGAAAFTAEGELFVGANVDNASTGLGMCAERVAIFQMVVAGYTRLSAIAVATESGSAPCGACRQVMREFGTTAEIALVAADGGVEWTDLGALLPRSFGPDDMGHDAWKQ